MRVEPGHRRNLYKPERTCVSMCGVCGRDFEHVATVKRKMCDDPRCMETLNQIRAEKGKRAKARLAAEKVLRESEARR